MVSEFFFRSWSEFLFFVLMIIGIIIALAAPSAVISYLVIFVSGMIAGRIMQWRQQKFHFPYYLVIIGFLIGYLIGVYYGDRKIVFILFVLGAFLSYYLYDKKILRDTFF